MTIEIIPPKVETFVIKCNYCERKIATTKMTNIIFTNRNDFMDNNTLVICKDCKPNITIHNNSWLKVS